MPQNQQLFTPFVKPDGGPTAASANNIGMLVAQMFPGNRFFVNATGGSDTTGNGSFRRPFATLDTGLEAAAANNGDAVIFRGTQARTATLAWNKNGVSLIGVNPGSQNNRARISGAGSTVFTPLVNVTAQGCMFLNVGTFYGYANASAQICWNDVGGRNYYENCQFNGGGNATAAAQAGMRSLTIGGEGENVFRDCTFGLDTIDRATNANATLEFINSGGQGQRNVFYNPVFRMQSALAGNCHVKAEAGATDRSQIMFNPVFFNGVDSSATTINAAVLWAASASLILAGVPISIGATKIATTGPVYVGLGAPDTGAGIAVKAT